MKEGSRILHRNRLIRTWKVIWQGKNIYCFSHKQQTICTHLFFSDLTGHWEVIRGELKYDFNTFLEHHSLPELSRFIYISCMSVGRTLKIWRYRERGKQSTKEASYTFLLNTAFKIFYFMIGAVRALSKTTTTAQCLIPTKQNKNHMIICTRIINNAYKRTHAYAEIIGTFFFLRLSLWKYSVSLTAYSIFNARVTGWISNVSALVASS